MMKHVCMFCMKAHRKMPALCQAKNAVMKSYTAQLPVWKVLFAVERGMIDLDGEAMRLIAREREAAKMEKNAKLARKLLKARKAVKRVRLAKKQRAARWDSLLKAHEKFGKGRA